MDSIKVSDFDLLFAVPIDIPVGKKGKKFILNMNKYRVAHWHILQEAKVNFNEMVAGLNLNDGEACFPFRNPVRFTYFYYPPTKRSYDRMNVLSVVDKFVCDALIKEKILVDDDYERVLTPKFLHCGVDAENPRVLVGVKEIING